MLSESVKVERGVAIIESAFVFPIAMTLILGAFGGVFYLNYTKQLMSFADNRVRELAMDSLFKFDDSTSQLISLSKSEIINSAALRAEQFSMHLNRDFGRIGQGTTDVVYLRIKIDEITGACLDYQQFGSIRDNSDIVEKIKKVTSGVPCYAALARPLFYDQRKYFETGFVVVVSVDFKYVNSLVRYFSKYTTGEDVINIFRTHSIKAIVEEKNVW